MFESHQSGIEIEPVYDTAAAIEMFESHQSGIEISLTYHVR